MNIDERLALNAIVRVNGGNRSAFSPNRLSSIGLEDYCIWEVDDGTDLTTTHTGTGTGTGSGSSSSSSSSSAALTPNRFTLSRVYTSNYLVIRRNALAPGSTLLFTLTCFVGDPALKDYRRASTSITVITNSAPQHCVFAVTNPTGAGAPAANYALLDTFLFITNYCWDDDDIMYYQYVSASCPAPYPILPLSLPCYYPHSNHLSYTSLFTLPYPTLPYNYTYQ